MKSKIRLAIVGTGNMANMHAIKYSKIKNVKIVACADINEKL